MRKHKSRRNKKNKVLIILTIIFIIMLIISLTKIFDWYKDNKKSSTITNNLKNIVDKNNNKYIIDFNKLKTINPDVVAYLIVKGTNIEYPIVKTNNNDYYLNHSLDRTLNSAGWPFINYINELNKTDKNITIYAHSRKDGSMFGTLYKTLSSNWQDNKDNHDIIFITEDSYNIYKVFSTYKILVEDYYIRNDFKTNEEYNNFLNTINKRSNYNYNVDLTNTDNILTLSTCASNDKYRIVLHAKKINI